MPETTSNRIISSINQIASEFTAVEHYEDRHIPLHGPEIIYTYESPERGIVQGGLCIFKAGDLPVILMSIKNEKGRIRIQASRLTDARIEIFHKDNIFTDLENNYLDQML
jgi:hypothetical protein